MMTEPTMTSILMIDRALEQAKRRTAAVNAKADELKRRGHAVTIDVTIGGLIRIDDGPELTLNQFLSLEVPS